MTGLGSPALTGRGPQPQLPVSPYAPQIDNIKHGAWVSLVILVAPHKQFGSTAILIDEKGLHNFAKGTYFSFII